MASAYALAFALEFGIWPAARVPGFAANELERDSVPAYVPDLGFDAGSAGAWLPVPQQE